MYTDKRLDDISDKIRRGVPVSILEALEAIEYNEMLKLKKQKQPNIFKRFWQWLFGV